MLPKSPSSFTAIFVFALAAPAVAQDYLYEKEPFNYWSATLSGPVTRLTEKLESGLVKLPLADEKVLLKALLKEFDIAQESQVLVFSKTSAQRELISPQQPRAIYFNDETYLGYVPGGMVEFTQMDPVLGAIFYQLDPNRPDRKVPKLDRSDGCMTCHASVQTDRLPGLMVRSVYTDGKGESIYQAGNALVDHRSPLETRWGGWYVTGTHGKLVHRGNGTAKMEDGKPVLNNQRGMNLATLEGLFPTERYLRNTSDIVALMVLEHQVGMQNRLTQAAYDLRKAIHQRSEMIEDETKLAESEVELAAKHVESLLQYLLFCGEAPLPENGIAGAASFVTAFQKNQRTSKSGGSLKEFDLKTRLFKNRCSYLIYSAEWDALPKPLLTAVYARLFEILSSKKPVAGYDHLTLDERAAILMILRETKPGLPKQWGS